MNLLEPKEVEINGRFFILSKFPAVAGRKIVANYTVSAIPKIGEYATNEATMFEIMKFVGVRLPSGEALLLTTSDLINNHTGDWETLLRLEMAAMEYNCSFFQNGSLSSFFSNITEKLPELATKILTGSLRQLFPQEKPPSTN